MSTRNVRRVNKKLVRKGTVEGVEIFQEASDNQLYYKDTNGVLVPLATDVSSLESSISSNTTNISTNTGDITALEASSTLKYFLYIDQASTSAPAVSSTIINNTGVTWTLARIGTGTYTITSDSPIDSTKVFAQVGSNDDAVVKVLSIVDSLGNTEITIRKYMMNGVALTDGLTDVSLSIQIVP